ncbi:hypothetical protein [Roseicitreum antarcticum]|uniref:hypothetical protein n=1 Tax=Roseicitreum antarcticum TaxID=564137 RepID=UPI0016803E1C|nr:hypothetical protein [Roseicitreum antarcticum]
MQTTNDQVLAWLDTFSPIASMKENPEALAREMETIAGCSHAKHPAWNHRQDIPAYQNDQHTAHPTAAQVYEALREVKREKTGEKVIGSQTGDRFKLDAINRSKLENEVIPTAKRWLGQFPGLRKHAISVLLYWNEPLIDDNGKEYEPSGKLKKTDRRKMYA